MNGSAMNLAKDSSQNHLIHPGKGTRSRLCPGQFDRGRVSLDLLRGITLLMCLMVSENFQPKLNAAESRSDGLLLICNKGDKTLGIIDPRGGHEIGTVAEEGE